MRQLKLYCTEYPAAKLTIGVLLVGRREKQEETQTHTTDKREGKEVS
jgi:hypothetical protein